VTIVKYAECCEEKEEGKGSMNNIHGKAIKYIERINQLHY